METGFLQIPYLKTKELNQISQFAHALEKEAVLHTISVVNWADFPYKPKVNFRIGHSGDKIGIKFYVEEEAVRAAAIKINGEVYKDSCVEFFVSFDGENYYNFEFSCIGTPHVAYGPGRHNRKFLPKKAIKQIELESTLGKKPFDTRTGGFSWELNAVIPVSSFVFDKGLKLSGLEASANFYKCGDELPTPHFVTWNPIGTEQPDYHRPEFFGKIKFS